MFYAKKIIVFVVCIFSVHLLSAQKNYVTHTLKPGESLSALAKQYNTSVGDIMRLNGMHADAKLVYGSKIKIPSTKNQTEVIKKTSTTIINTSPLKTPSNEITHVVTKGETLYSIGKKYNITVEQIKAWNHLGDDNAKVGTLLVISDNGINKIETTSSQKQRVETVTAAQQTNAAAVNKADTKTEINNIQNTKIDTGNSAVQPSAQTENNATDLAINQASTSYTGEGYFQSQFKDKKAKQTQTISGISKTFKTTSGWSDGKYYILVNDIEPGTIVKITADNGNAVYAKVLWNMGDLKENSGINFRVSNATAAALHEDESSFNVNVSF